MAQFLTPIFLQGSDASANPLSGAKLNIYATGTTTLLSLFSDETLATPISNPIVADSAGVFAGAFLAETTFKAILTTSADVVLYTRDPVYSIGQADDVSAENVAYDGTALGFSSTNLQDAITELAGSFIEAPPTTVDNTIPRFNGTSGQIQETSIVVADTTNDMSGVGQITQTATGANTLPKGTTAQRPGSPAAGMWRYNSTLALPEYYGSAWVPVSRITSGTAQATTSGTSKDFTGIPSWAKRVTIIMSAVSTSGSSAVLVQLGTASGFETTEYTCLAVDIFDSGSEETSLTSSSAGFRIGSSHSLGASASRNGRLTIDNLDGNTWVASGVFATDDGLLSAGSKTLAAALTQVRLTTANGSDTFDAGSVNILYE